MLKIAIRYLFYRLFAPHRKGFGVHSPFVFHLVSRVLTREDDEGLKQILAWRKALLHDRSRLMTSGAGAGSKVHGKGERSISQIARKSSIRHKYGRILYSLVKEFRPETIVELGTGIGISTAYLAKANDECRIITVESDKEKIAFAERNFKQSGFNNVSLRNEEFSLSLGNILKEANHPLLVFVDGDHSLEGTLRYFREIRDMANRDTIIVFDDIRWSEGMEEAWRQVKKDPAVIISIDLFFIGIVFFKEGISKQDFVINF